MMTMNMLVRQKKDFDLGIWSSAGLEDSQNMVKNIFGRYLSQLLFVMYTDREQFPPDDEFKDNEYGIKPYPLVRNLANVWNKYPQYSEENTLMVSNYYNEIEDF
jgi:hypothetical protein